MAEIIRLRLPLVYYIPIWVPSSAASAITDENNCDNKIAPIEMNDVFIVGL